MMNEKVTQMISLLFRDVQPSEEVQALHDEVLNNCQERFSDLTRGGLSEEEALAAVMESLKGMDEVLREYPRKDAENQDSSAKEAEETPAPEKAEDPGPKLITLNPQEVKAIEAGLTSCEVTVLASEGEFTLETTGPIFSNLEPDGTLRLWQERTTENLFKGIAWEKSFSSFESFGDAMNRLGQNISQLVSRNFSIVREPGNIEIESIVKKAVLRIPADCHPEIQIRTTSGEISWREVIPGRNFTLGSTSGDIRVELDESFLLPRAEISTTSGDVELRMSAEEAYVKTVSGDLTWEGDAGVLDMNSTSGDVDAIGRVPELRMNSTSGDLHLELPTEQEAHITMNTVSGDVDIRVPAQVEEISANLNTRSGDMRTRGLFLVREAPIQVDANSVSGDLRIHR